MVREKIRIRFEETARARAALGVALALGAIACSPGPAPIARSQRDPSNPSAPEGTLPMAGAPAQAPPIDGGATLATYTCPMHPEVTSSAPGRCPKCGMTLVRK